MKYLFELQRNLLSQKHEYYENHYSCFNFFRTTANIKETTANIKETTANIRENMQSSNLFSMDTFRRYACARSSKLASAKAKFDVPELC